jgi:hypothetical protein
MYINKNFFYGNGSIHGWGTKKGKGFKDFLISYFLQITFT